APERILIDGDSSVGFGRSLVHRHGAYSMDGRLDVYQWLQFLALHARRHVAQTAANRATWRAATGTDWDRVAGTEVWGSEPLCPRLRNRRTAHRDAMGIHRAGPGCPPPTKPLRARTIFSARVLRVDCARLAGAAARRRPGDSCQWARTFT